MPGRTLDAIIQENLGIKEMVLMRLLWQIEDLKAQNAVLQAECDDLQTRLAALTQTP